MVHITSRRFTERTNAVTNVKIYSNTKEVELLLNGIPQGKPSNGTNCVFVWENVTLKPGENQIAAKAERDGKKLSDSCVWTLK
jgi:beta-galactosidase